MGVVLPYYHPARVVEEIGMLDHLTGGRLEIGTAIGVPQELARLNMTMAEARERNDEIVTILDAALANRVISHEGKYFSLSNLRLLPRPLQQPSPPRSPIARKRTPPDSKQAPNTSRCGGASLWRRPARKHICMPKP
jgi:alkanesulfonate monooxygenase SsuD/methylene tetrahydromethanopterin reductase-like flavin-dependent oxidoreductase (luciferase family)